jgi:hypothetical protein
MLRSITVGFLAALATACASDAVPTSIETQAEMPLQGTQLQGMQLLGSQLQGMTMVGFQYAGATLHGASLANLRIEHGELVADQGQVTLRGAALVNMHLQAQVHNLATNPVTTAVVDYQITAVAAESAIYDPLQTGATYVYTVAQNVDATGVYQAACPADVDANHIAIPIAATWNEHGDRVESTALFTLGCTYGVIAKCYRWGYRPWVTGYGDLVTMHQICTRMARADYCGNGTTHTRDGTMINAWDNLPAPGPIMHHTTAPTGMTFEAGWSTSGAVCLSHARWLLGGPTVAAVCPDRLVAPNLLLGGTVCDTESQVLGAASPRMYDDSNLNLNLDLL